MLSDKQHINLHLDAHTVGLDVPREAEPNYRNAAELLNRRYQYYLKLRPNASAEQLWMYTALEVAVALQSDAREKSLEPVERELKKLNEEIRPYLTSHEKGVNE
ncbi:MAG: cell division protein ZapA [Paludibacteraceae bacterium]|nr:cell division protein ZapA [Paludibacteraceae bacterium]